MPGMRHDEFHSGSETFVEVETVLFIVFVSAAPGGEAGVAGGADLQVNVLDVFLAAGDATISQHDLLVRYNQNRTPDQGTVICEVKLCGLAALRPKPKSGVLPASCNF